MAYFEFDDAELKAWMARVGAKAGNQNELKAELQQSLKRVGTSAMQTVKARTPVDTGTLRRNWSIDGPMIGGAVISLEIFNNTEYAAFVENGHRTRGGGGWVPGQFFLRDSMAQISSTLPALITPGLAKALEGLLD